MSEKVYNLNKNLDFLNKIYAKILSLALAKRKIFKQVLFKNIIFFFCRLFKTFLKPSHDILLKIHNFVN